VARRGIAAGEEVTNDYSINSWGEGTWSCNCGAGRCRCEIAIDFFSLPEELLGEYLALLAPWFRAMFPARLAETRARLG
jgi:hypothetical protein